MAKRQTDEELNLRRKARRRLIGAVALTLAVVVILPMLLDSEPKSARQDIDLRIPDPDKAGEFIPGVAVPPDPLADDDESNTVAASAVIPQETVIPKGSVKQPATTVKAGPDNSGKMAQPKPSPTKPAATNVTDKPINVAAEGFVVQVGAYSNADTVKQELDKLKKWGFKAYSEKAGEMIRVRVGPYTGREQAEKAREQLEKRGLKPVVMGAK